MQTNFIKNCVKGFLVSILSSVVLLLLFGWICFMQEDPDGLIGILGRVALYVSAFLGGLFASRFNRSMGLVSGLTTGGIFMLTVVMLSMFLRESDSPLSFMTWVMFLLIAVVAALGGYFGVPSGKRKKRRAHKKNK